MTRLPLFSALVTYDGVRDKVVLDSIYAKDNAGSIWLKANYPHLMSQLDAMTQQWTLLPKAIVRNAAMLKQLAESYRDNLKYGSPIEGTNEQQQRLMRSIEELLTFLETKVYPALQHMPEDRKEVETDAFAEAFAENDIERDESEEYSEAEGETQSDNP